MIEVTPGLKYNIKNSEYTVPEHLIFTDKQYMLEKKILDELYDLLKYATKKFNNANPPVHEQSPRKPSLDELNDFVNYEEKIIAKKQ